MLALSYIHFLFGYSHQLLWIKCRIMNLKGTRKAFDTHLLSLSYMPRAIIQWGVLSSNMANEEELLKIGSDLAQT